jgi:hypothetical protein
MEQLMSDVLPFPGGDKPPIRHFTIDEAVARVVEEAEALGDVLRRATRASASPKKERWDLDPDLFMSVWWGVVGLRDLLGQLGVGGALKVKGTTADLIRAAELARRPALRTLWAALRDLMHDAGPTSHPAAPLIGKPWRGLSAAAVQAVLKEIGGLRRPARAGKSSNAAGPPSPTAAEILQCLGQHRALAAPAINRKVPGNPVYQRRLLSGMVKAGLLKKTPEGYALTRKGKATSAGGDR